jgi:hypothetical protein
MAGLMEYTTNTVCGVTPGGASASLLVADLCAANHGLGNAHWEPRAVYLHALKKVMTTWKGEVPPIILAEKV